MKKVLIISYYSPPVGAGSVLRTVKFAKYFQRINWEPIILTCTPRNYYAKDDFLLKELSGIRIFRTKGSSRNLINENRIIRLPNEKKRKFYENLFLSFRIPDTQIIWKKKAVELASEILEKEDINIIYCTAPPFTDFLIGAELKEKYGTRLVVDYRDSWLYSQSNFYPTSFHKFRNRKLEQEIIRVADEIITINRKIKEHIIEEYPNVDHGDIKIIPHGFDQEDFNNASFHLPRTNKMRFTHAGYFFNPATPKYFLEGLAIAIKKKPEIKYRTEACFLGLLSKENLKLIQKLGLHSVVYSPGYVNHLECIKYFIASDVLWLTVGKGKDDDLVSTIKLSEYIGTRKPILASIPDGVIKQSLRFYDAVKFCEPDSPEEIADAILEYYELFTANKLPLPNEDVVQKFNIEKLTTQLIRHFEFLIDITPQTKVKARIVSEEKIVTGNDN